MKKIVIVNHKGGVGKLNFFNANKIPFGEMKSMDHLIGNQENNKEKYCFAREGEVYVVYLAYVSTSTIDLTGTNATFSVNWFNPREGGKLLDGKISSLKGGKIVELGTPPANPDEDWVVLLKKQ